jgi:RNA polymerase sigma-70 factor (ECF subfamily)
MAVETGAITILLHRWREGDKEAESQLFRLLMPDLRRIAGRCFRGERARITIQPTALVNEAFLRLANAKNIAWHDRGHFLAIAARVMRRLLIDHARVRPTVQFAPIEGVPEPILRDRTPLELVITLDHLLEELEKRSIQQRTIVELKFFLGLTDEEAAEAMGVSLRTLQREWHDARKWLFEQLTKEEWKSVSKAMDA